MSLDTGFAGWRTKAADGDIYAGHERFDLADLSLEELPKVRRISRTCSTHTASSSPPMVAAPSGPTATCSTSATATPPSCESPTPNHYTWGLHGPEQWIYSHTDDRVFTLGIDFDTHQVQEFRRSTGELTRSWGQAPSVRRPPSTM